MNKSVLHKKLATDNLNVYIEFTNENLESLVGALHDLLEEIVKKENPHEEINKVWLDNASDLISLIALKVIEVKDIKESKKPSRVAKRILPALNISGHKLTNLQNEYSVSL